MTGKPNHTLGPIAQLRHASRSRSGLALGVLLGAIVPIAVSDTVHNSGLIDISPEWRGYFAWLLVVGGMGFSAKTVYRWGCSAFQDRWKAAGFVLLVEAALLLSPSPALGHAALAYLVVINALGTGSALAQQDHVDRAHESQETTARPAVAHVPVSPVPAPVALPIPPVPALPPIPESPEPKLPERAPTAPRKAVPPPLPKAHNPPIPATDSDLYARAVAYARTVSELSAGLLARELHCRRGTAADLIARLEANGVVGPADPALRGRRPVLQSALVEAAQ